MSLAPEQASPQSEGCPDEFRLLLCSCPKKTASELARSFVQERLAACVSIIPGVKSVYEWKGELCEEEEQMLLIKTTSARLPALTSRVNELHPYELPELIALAIQPDEGGLRYLTWLAQSVAPEL